MDSKVTVSCSVKIDNIDEVANKVKELNEALEKASSVIQELAAINGMKALVEV